jgi:hypothetical protein
MPLLSRSSRGFGKNTDSQITDVNAKYTTALITGETPTKTWIDDASQNTFALTPTGSPAPSKFTPYNSTGYYSTYFDGASVVYANAPALPATFTIEMWLFLPVPNNDKYVYSGGSATGGPLININSNIILSLYIQI